MELKDRDGCVAFTSAWEDPVRALLEHHERGGTARHLDLKDSDLSYMRADRVDFTAALLTGANLNFAQCNGAVFDRAGLRGAELSGASLRGASFAGATADAHTMLIDADLAYADVTAFKHVPSLAHATLGPVRNDVFSILDTSPVEVPAFRAALRAGKVNGTTYQAECCCLVGTLARARGLDPHSVPGLTPDSNRMAEKFVYAIREGDTPDNCVAARILDEWVTEWMTAHEARVAKSIADSDTAIAADADKAAKIRRPSKAALLYAWELLTCEYESRRKSAGDDEDRSREDGRDLRRLEQVITYLRRKATR